MRTEKIDNPILIGGLAFAACAAACAAALLPALLAGTGLLAIGTAALSEGTIVLLAIPVVGLLYLYHRRRSAVVAGAGGPDGDTDNCGCGDANPDDLAVSDHEPIACSLDASSAEQRMAALKSLSDRALRNVSRSDLELNLTYAPESEDEIRELVRAEEQCCAFLDFDLSRDESGVYLRVMAPESARAAAEDLFAKFAPRTD